MPDTTCNGYTNWDTWIVCLYSDNEQSLYDRKLNAFNKMILSGAGGISNVTACSIALNIGLVEFCQKNEPEFAAALVDWTDIANSWTTELDEFARYNA